MTTSLPAKPEAPTHGGRPNGRRLHPGQRARAHPATRRGCGGCCACTIALRPGRLPRPSSRARQAILAVEDDAPGFPPAFLPADFERFSRPDAGRTGDGAGLSLAIAATVARAHGGDADAGNGPAGGAYVRLRIPDQA